MTASVGLPPLRNRSLPAIDSAACRGCRSGTGLDFTFSMAFQPFVDTRDGSVFGYEALVRGENGEPASTVLAQVNEHNRYGFDQACRLRAIEIATRIGLQGILSINFLPNAIYRPETCIRATLDAADRLGFSRDRLMFEVTEGERVDDHAHLAGIFAEYKKRGFRTAIDDFGAGYSGLNLLAEFQPDYIKLDMALTRNIHQDRVRRAIVGGILATSRSLGVDVIAEGIECAGECEALVAMGVHLFQGYFFARPAFESLPQLSPEAVAKAR